MLGRPSIDFPQGLAIRAVIVIQAPEYKVDRFRSIRIMLMKAQSATVNELLRPAFNFLVNPREE